MDGPLGIATELCVELEADKSMLEGGKGGGGGGVEADKSKLRSKVKAAGGPAVCAVQLQTQY